MVTPSELEGCVLGIVARDGPLTPYAVRKVFRESPSPSWSGSAGAIYPLLRRLESDGLLRSASRPTGRRPARAYRVTAAGRRALRRWLGPPLPDEAGGVPVDALRTRVEFLGLLPADERSAFLAAAKDAVAAHLRRIRARARASEDDLPARLAHRGAILQLRARLAWLDEVGAAWDEA